MRIVRVGQPGNLYRLKEGELPKDARQSFLMYVDLSGLDLSDCDLRDSDIISCNARNVTLGEGKTGWLMSRNTDWTGAKLPSDIGSTNWDFMKEWFRQHVPADQDEELLIAKAMEKAQDGAYTTSWRAVLHHEIHDLGLSKEKVFDINAHILTGQTKLTARLRQQFADDRIDDQKAQMPTYYDKWRLPRSRDGVVLVDLTDKIPLTLDRYQAARDLEAVLEEELGEPFLVWFWLLWPYPYPMIFPSFAKPKFGWWANTVID